MTSAKKDIALLALDQGTTSTRAILFDKAGNILAMHQKEHAQYYPAEHCVEHDANEIWQNAQEVCRAAVHEATERGYHVLSMGITNQRETVVAWDKTTGEPLARALVWQDKRTLETCEKLARKYTAKVKEKTGLPIDAYFSATKYQWLLEHEPAVKQAAGKGTLALGTIETYLLFRLTEGASFYTDVTNASRTLLLNLETAAWDADLCRMFHVPEKYLAQVCPNTFDFGISQEHIIGAAIPIQGMAGDQQAATIGQACFEVGDVKSTYGTGCFMVLNTGEEIVRSQNGLLSTIMCQIGKRRFYGLEGSIFVAGSAVQWLRDKMQMIDSASASEALVHRAKDDDAVYLVPAFVGMGAPYWVSDARATLTGLTLDTTNADVVRATLDAVVFQTNDLLNAMRTDTGRAIETVRVDGGMVANNWLLQRLADICRISMERPAVIETTALGVAYLAGLQAGVYADLETLRAQWQQERVATPQMPKEMMQKKVAGWHHAVAQALGR